MENTTIAASPLDIPVRGWMPIETAPTDRTVVLLHKDGEVFAGWYDAHGAYGWCFLEDPRLLHETWGEYIEPNAYMRGGNKGPTHWMPLPEAPNAGVTGLAPGKED